MDRNSRKFLAGDGQDDDVVAKFAIDREECAAGGQHEQEMHAHVRGHATVLHGNNTEG